MEKLESHSWKEAAWRSRLQRHAQSGKSIAAFCRAEAVSTASFHIWRAKLAAANEHAANLEMDWTGLKLLLEGIEPKQVRKRYKKPSVCTQNKPVHPSKTL